MYGTTREDNSIPWLVAVSIGRLFPQAAEKQEWKPHFHDFRGKGRTEWITTLWSHSCALHLLWMRLFSITMY